MPRRKKGKLNSVYDKIGENREKEKKEENNKEVIKVLSKEGESDKLALERVGLKHPDKVLVPETQEEESKREEKPLATVKKEEMEANKKDKKEKEKEDGKEGMQSLGDRNRSENPRDVEKDRKDEKIEKDKNVEDGKNMKIIDARVIPKQSPEDDDKEKSKNVMAVSPNLELEISQAGITLEAINSVRMMYSNHYRSAHRYVMIGQDTKSMDLSGLMTVKKTVSSLIDGNSIKNYYDYISQSFKSFKLSGSQIAGLDMIALFLSDVSFPVSRMKISEKFTLPTITEPSFQSILVYEDESYQFTDIVCDVVMKIIGVVLMARYIVYRRETMELVKTQSNGKFDLADFDDSLPHIWMNQYPSSDGFHRHVNEISSGRGTFLDDIGATVPNYTTSFIKTSERHFTNMTSEHNDINARFKQELVLSYQIDQNTVNDYVNVYGGGRDKALLRNEIAGINIYHKCPVAYYNIYAYMAIINIYVRQDIIEPYVKNLVRDNLRLSVDTISEATTRINLQVGVDVVQTTSFDTIMTRAINNQVADEMAKIMETVLESGYKSIKFIYTMTGGTQQVAELLGLAALKLIFIPKVVCHGRNGFMLFSSFCYVCLTQQVVAGSPAAAIKTWLTTLDALYGAGASPSTNWSDSVQNLADLNGNNCYGIPRFFSVAGAFAVIAAAQAGNLLSLCMRYPGVGMPNVNLPMNEMRPGFRDDTFAYRYITTVTQLEAADLNITPNEITNFIEFSVFLKGLLPQGGRNQRAVNYLNTLKAPEPRIRKVLYEMNACLRKCMSSTIPILVNVPNDPIAAGAIPAMYDESEFKIKTFNADGSVNTFIPSIIEIQGIIGISLYEKLRFTYDKKQKYSYENNRRCGNEIIFDIGWAWDTAMMVLRLLRGSLNPTLAFVLSSTYANADFKYLCSKLIKSSKVPTSLLIGSMFSLLSFKQIMLDNFFDGINVRIMNSQHMRLILERAIEDFLEYPVSYGYSLGLRLRRRRISAVGANDNTIVLSYLPIVGDAASLIPNKFERIKFNNIVQIADLTANGDSATLFGGRNTTFCDADVVIANDLDDVSISIMNYINQTPPTKLALLDRDVNILGLIPVKFVRVEYNGTYNQLINHWVNGQANRIPILHVPYLVNDFSVYQLTFNIEISMSPIEGLSQFRIFEANMIRDRDPLHYNISTGRETPLALPARMQNGAINRHSNIINPIVLTESIEAQVLDPDVIILYDPTS